MNNSSPYSGLPKWLSGEECTCQAGDVDWEDPLEKGTQISALFCAV